MDFELLEYMNESSKMISTRLKELLKLLEDKKNKIKKDIKEALSDYENYNRDIKKLITKKKDKTKDIKTTTRISVKMITKKEIKKDNSDAAIAHMIMQGVTITIIDLESMINKFDKELDKKILKVSKEYLNFNKKQIDIYKEYL
jgi:hypothetical protein